MGHYFFQQVLCRRADQALAQCRQDSILTSIQARRPHIAVGGGCPAVPKEYLCAVEAHSLECHRRRAMPDGMKAEWLHSRPFAERAHKLAALLKGLAQHAVAVYLHKDVIRLAGPRLAPPRKSLVQLWVNVAPAHPLLAILAFVVDEPDAPLAQIHILAPREPEHLAPARSREKEREQHDHILPAGRFP